MKAFSDMIAVLATVAVMVRCPAWAGEEGKATEAAQIAAAAQSGTAQVSGNLAFTPIIQRAFPTGPDYRGAICFETGAAPWWPQASWIRTPRTEEIEAKVKRWLERHQIDASGDENRGLVGHGMVVAEMKVAFVDVTPQMIVEATQGLDSDSHGLSPTDQPVQFPHVFAFRTSRGRLGILEIRGFDDRKLVKFRYKLVKSDERATPPPTPPPPALLAEIGRESVEETIHNLLFKTPAISSAARPVGRPTADYFDRVAGEPRVAKILKQIRAGMPSQQEAIRKAILRECKVYVEQLPDRRKEGGPWSPSVTDPGGGAAYPLLLRHCDPRAESLPMLVAMFHRFQILSVGGHISNVPGTMETCPTQESAWIDSQAGVFWAYACQHFLDRMAADPQWQARLKPDQLRVLKAYRQYREASKPLGEFLCQLEMMRFAGELVATGQPPAPREVEEFEKAAFESLTIEMSGFWIGRQAIAIRGDGKYTFDLKDYHAAYQLKPEHVRSLEELLKATDWLTMPADRMMATDLTTYTMTLNRAGRKATIASHDVPKGSYRELIRFIRRIERQETFLHQATIPDRRSHVAHELKSELDALAGRPVVRPYASVLDYHRLVPVFTRWLAKPRGHSDSAIEAAAALVALLKIESQRPNLEAIARTRVPYNPKPHRYSSARKTVIAALGRLGGGPSLSVLESLQADSDPFVRRAVAEALLTAPPAEAIPILREMTTDTRSAAWALIRLGDKAEPAILDILEEPTFRGSGPKHLIREYYEHWKELPAPPSAAVVAAIYDTVQAEAGRGGPDQYGLDVLKFAGNPLVIRNAWQDLQEALSLMATEGQQKRKKLLLATRFRRSDEAPEEFLKDAEAGNLKIRRIMADRTSALAHLADQKGEVKYVLWLNRTGVVWDISVVWTVSAGNVQARINHFRENHPQAKEVKADDAVLGPNPLD